MSWLKLLEAPVKAKVTKVSPDGKKLSIDQGPGKSLELDLDKATGVDVVQDRGQTTVKLNKKKGPNVGPKIKPGQQVNIEEGPNDRYIFKAVFMAGGPGSGKSHVAREVLKQFDLKVVDSDKMFEYLMSKKGMDVGDPEQIFSPDGQATRDHGKELMAKQKQMWLDGKLGVVIDGTGRDVEKTAKIRKEMIDLGYGTMMLFVNTELDVAQQRNLQRPRKLPKDAVTAMWRAVQDNIMKFQQLFGSDRFIVIDNSGGLEDPTRSENFKKVENNIRKFLTAEPRNRIAKAWISKNKK